MAESVKNFTDQMLTPDELSKYELLFVDFWAPWCGPCRMMGPVIEQLANELSGKLTFGKLNIDDYGDIASANRVVSIPTMILYRQGREVERIVGATSKAQLAQKLAQYLPNKN